jgi:phosphatidate phosphatase APP1
MPPPLYRVAYEGKGLWNKAGRRLRHRLGLTYPPRFFPYRGFGTAQRVLVRGRVLEDRNLDFDAESPVRRIMTAYRRYATREIPREPVIVRWGERAYAGHSNREGYVDLWIEPPSGTAAGWHRLDVELPRRKQPAAPADVLVIGSQARFAVISDIDDTVIETRATNPLKRAQALFWASAESRLPFEGVAAFYSALARGGDGQCTNPIFYLSSSPWNIHDHIVDMLDRHEIPRGPILLRDWGFGPSGFNPTGSHRHKVEQVARVLEVVSDIRFVLIGDSGQEDALRYAAVVREHPDRILAVYLRDVGRHGPGFAASVAQMQAAGVPAVVTADTVTAVRHAEAAALVTAPEVRHVSDERERDHQREGLLDRLGRDATVGG